MEKPNPGLRTQLLLGLVLIVLVATVSVGAITTWATRSQVSESQLAGARVIGNTVARLLTPELERDARRLDQLHRVTASLASGTLLQRVEVVDRAGELLASSSRPAGGKASDPLLTRTLGTGLQALQLSGEGDRIEVRTPIFARGAVAGAVRVDLSFGTAHLRWPSLFWVLMTIDGLLLVIFVGFVMTRYVIRPIRSMQQAATSVTAGDLSVRLPEEGARELASLAASFNTMTASVQEQLVRLERQRAELAASREQVIRSEKLASVGRLAAGVAHEVGNPLQAIMGFTDMLLSGRLKPEESQDFLGRIDRETQRINRIIRELLDYARPVEDALEAVSLSAAVEQALQLVGPQKRLREVATELSGLDDLPPVAANSQRLVQVLVNLLLNAADAMQGAGRIAIRAGPAADGERVELRVANDGPAIPPVDRGRVFDPFFTTKEPGEGTGLGLCVAQSIAESYGGRLYLEDAGSGAGEAGLDVCFVMTLHRWRPEAREPGDAPEGGQPAADLAAPKRRKEAPRSHTDGD